MRSSFEPTGPTRSDRPRGGRLVTAPVFLAMTEDEVARAWRYDRMLSAALVRIDELERPTGSGAKLRAVDIERAILETACAFLRVPDRVALVGPGELAILLPETGAHQAHVVMERLRKRVAAGPLHARDVHFNATLSIGTASLTYRVRSARQILMAARQERRRAQAGGGNRVMTVTPVRTATTGIRNAELH